MLDFWHNILLHTRWTQWNGTCQIDYWPAKTCGNDRERDTIVSFSLGSRSHGQLYSKSSNSRSNFMLHCQYYYHTITSERTHNGTRKNWRYKVVIQAWVFSKYNIIIIWCGGHGQFSLVCYSSSKLWTLRDRVQYRRFTVFHVTYFVLLCSTCTYSMQHNKNLLKVIIVVIVSILFNHGLG